MQRVHNQRACSSLLLSFILWLSHVPLDTWEYKVIQESSSSGTTSKNFLLFTFLLSCEWHSEWVRAKTNSQNKAHLFDRPLPPDIWSHPPTCGIEEEDLSKLRSWEVYFDWTPWFPHPKMKSCGWDPVRKRFVMISLCVYNAHRTVVLSGLWLSWIIVEVRVGWNSCHSHTCSIWCAQNKQRSDLINTGWMIKMLP